MARLERATDVRTAPWARRVAVTIFAVTVAQLAVAAFAPGLPQFEGKAFGARPAAYPLLMLVVPVAWWVRRGRVASTPWPAFALVMSPFLIDVTGNTLDLYDRVAWWDDANHLVNWFLLCTGIGLLLARARVRPLWTLALLVAGVGALLAIAWEAAEWFAFIRHGTELDTAYRDTLLDEVLGSLGAALGGLVVVRVVRTTIT